jgi:4-diphosphocytidyl-2-C-methyl-D-erythritol kinase
MKGRSFRSFAKINLGLEVVRRLPNGFHELKTLFASVSLHDVIDISPRKSGISIWSDDPSLPTGETNLAHRAATLMMQRFGRRSGLRINIWKSIPVGGGLGGGSSNAATVLRALDLTWGLGLGTSGLLDPARSLGADVPYFLTGGPALGLGRGDVIHPLDLRVAGKVLLIPGPSSVSTASVFQRFAALRDSGMRRTSPIDAYLRSVSGGSEKASPKPLRSLRNDLERAALDVSPALLRTSRLVRQVGLSSHALQAAMSGSGSTYFMVFKDSASRSKAAGALAEAGLASHACSFVSRRSYLDRFQIQPADSVLR